LKRIADGEQVLLVGDLDMLRKMVRDFLESLGMHVLEASSAAEAIHTARSDQRATDLLLTDTERLLNNRLQMGVFLCN
jgi:CheY-like chemotaxis protein